MEHPRRTRTRTIVLLLFMAVSLFLGWIVWLALQPAPERPDLSIRIIGYTNDPSGTRLAIVAVTNQSPSTVYACAPRIEVEAPANPSQLADFHANLASGEGKSFAIPTPTNQANWRISMYVYNDRGLKHLPRHVLSGRRMPFAIHGEWVSAEE